MPSRDIISFVTKTKIKFWKLVSQHWLIITLDAYCDILTFDNHSIVLCLHCYDGLVLCLFRQIIAESLVMGSFLL